MQQDILVSIIIPVYNAAPFLDKCLESVCNQTYRNLQIIIADDGSTDGSRNIIRKYAERDNRIETIIKENEGVNKTRKICAQRCKGDYIGCVDADDWIENDYYEKLVSVSEKGDIDIVAGALFFDIDDDSQIIKNHISPGKYKTEDILPRMLYCGDFFEYGIQPHLVTKLIKRDIFWRAIRESDDRVFIGEDSMILYSAVLLANTVLLTETSGYHYIQHAQSATKNRSIKDIENLKCLVGYLDLKFQGSHYYPILHKQLIQYTKYLLVLRDIGYLDTLYGYQLLYPYGGILKKDRIILYGAGVVGQNIYQYLRKNKINLVAWCDKNWTHYDTIDFSVEPPEKIKEYDFDKIIICNINVRIQLAIKQDLKKMGIDERSICCFSEEFMKSELERMFDGI